MIAITAISDNTARVTIDGTTRVLPAKINAERITVTGIAVKFPTGTRVWNSEITLWIKSGRINQPKITNMDFRGHQRMATEVVGFYGDFSNPSQHVAQCGAHE